MANLYAMRVNLSVAIVAMTQSGKATFLMLSIVQNSHQCQFFSVLNSEQLSNWRSVSPCFYNQERGHLKIECLWKCCFSKFIFQTLETPEFDWDSNDQGLILGAFFYGYIITQIPGGYFSEKFGGKWFLFFGTLATTVFTLLSPVSARYSSTMFVACRILMGLGEVKKIILYFYTKK